MLDSQLQELGQHTNASLGRRSDMSKQLEKVRKIFLQIVSFSVFIALCAVGINRLLKLEQSSHNSIPLLARKRKHGDGNRAHLLLVGLESETEIVKMSNFFNKMYTGPLSIGTPSQSFEHIVLDTGSADLWVLSSQGTGIPKKGYLNYFDSSGSSTYNGPNGNWQIQYGTGSASGYAGKDTVSIAGLTADPQSFAQAYVVDDMSISSVEPQDGICGFARSAASKLGGSTIMETLVSQGDNPSGLFSFYLSQHGDSGSKLMIGEPDSAYFEGDSIENWFTVASDYGYDVSGLWAIAVDSITVGSTDITASSSASSTYAIVDTGTTYIGVPTAYYSQLMKTITAHRSDCNAEGSSSDDVYLCSDTANPTKHLPTVQITLTNTEGVAVTYDLSPNNYLDDDGQLGFQSISVNIWIFGDTFLKTYVSVYDDTNSMIGLATAISHNSLLSDALETVLIVVCVVGAILVLLSVLRCYVTHKGRIKNREELLATN